MSNSLSSDLEDVDYGDLIPLPIKAPTWVDEYLPNNGPCLICGNFGYDQRHRTLDNIHGMISGGDSIKSVADDFGLPTKFVERIYNEYKEGWT